MTHNNKSLTFSLFILFIFIDKSLIILSFRNETLFLITKKNIHKISVHLDTCRIFLNLVSENNHW